MSAIALFIATVGFRLGEAYETVTGPLVTAKKNTVIIRDKDPAAYMLVAHVGDEVMDVQMAYGEKAVAKILGAGDKALTIDVYRVDAVGSLYGPNMKPCVPAEESGADEPDCTPTRGFPPVLPPRFVLLDALFR